MVRMAVAFESGLFLLALGLGWLVGTPPLKQVILTWQVVGWSVVAVCPPLLGMWWCTSRRQGPFTELMREMVERVGPLFENWSQFELALISVVAGMGEEALFRGVIQQALAGWLNPWAGLFLAGGLFGLGHFVTPMYALLAGLMGLYLGGLLIGTGNLLVVIVVHALYDFVALNYLIRRHKAEQMVGFGARLDEHETS